LSDSETTRQTARKLSACTALLEYYTSLRANSLGLLILQLYLYLTIRSGSTGADCPMTRDLHTQRC